MFETLRTAFKVLVANLTQDKLIVMGLIALGLMIIWSVVTLLINSQVRFRKSCFSIIKFLKENEVTSENYPKFIRLWASLPASMRFAWKRYENAKSGKASDYLSQNECVDLYVSGGLQKQNRSLMRSCIAVCVSFIVLFSISIIGTTTSSGATNCEFTTSLVVDMLIIPFVLYLLFMVNYYIYTAIRHQQYKLMVDVFYDLLDCLDDKIDFTSIFGAETGAIGLVSSVYENETMQMLIEETRKERNKKMDQTGVTMNGGAGLTPLKSGVLGVKDAADNTNKNVIKTDKVVSNKLSEPEVEGDFKIKNEAEFVETVNRVDELLALLETEKKGDKRKELEAEVNIKIKALTDYKQKAKIKPAKK